MKKVMKCYILIVIQLQFLSMLEGQENLDSIIFSNTGAIQQDNITFIEVEGYNIFVEIWNKKYNSKTIKKIKRKYKVTSEVSENKEELLKETHQGI